MQKIMKNKGITLVALVVSIIIMLILAGVTLNIALGDNGIIKQAQKAADLTKESMENEEKDFGMLVDELDEVVAQSLPSTVKEAIQKGEIFTVNKKITDEVGDTMTVPKGFKVKEGTDVDKGIVIADIEGNEFVWVPCTVDEYKKHVYNNTENDIGNYVEDKSKSGEANAGWNTFYYRAYSDWKDDEIDEAANKESVKNNGGFYISRYEAGVPSNADFYVDAASEPKTYQESKNDIGTDLKPVSKKAVQAWNLIGQINAKEVSGRMYSGDTHGVRSQLVDGTAWDTVVTWMSEEYEDIEKDSTSKGNYENSTNENKFEVSNTLFAEHLRRYEGTSSVWCTAKNYQYGTFISGVTNSYKVPEGEETNYNNYDSDTKYRYNRYVEMATGASNNTKLKNIYDMAGNMYEWTTEYGYHGSTSNGVRYAVRRGGCFNTYGNQYPVSMRGGEGTATSEGGPNIGFRVVLYIK